MANLLRAFAMTKTLGSCLLIGLALPLSAGAQLAQTPPMGWNSWNHFGASVTDAIVRAQAKAMVTTGMSALGYEYVMIDDGWQGTRDVNGNIQPNSNFPDMAGLAQFVHSLGLKLGIYSSPGPKTCSGHIGSYGYESQDSQTFANWGMDYLKYDWCSATGSKQAVYLKMALALQATGRPFVYAISEYGISKVWTWGQSVYGNLWRTGEDIKDDFFRMAELGFGQNGLEHFAGPGHWNDPDMLEVGNGGMTDSEYQVQVTLWCILAAPLIAGNDLTAMTPDIQALLTDAEVIAVDQDALGVQGHRVWQQGPQEIWVKPLADGSKAVGVFNRDLGSVSVALPFSKIGVTGSVSARDLWAQSDLGVITTGYKVTLGTHSAALLKLQ